MYLPKIPRIYEFVCPLVIELTLTCKLTHLFNSPTHQPKSWGLYGSNRLSTQNNMIDSQVRSEILGVQMMSLQKGLGKLNSQIELNLNYYTF